MQKWILIAGMACISACAKTWYHPSKTMQQFHADNANCQAMAGYGSGNQSAPTYGTGFGAGFAQGMNQGSALGAALQRNSIYDSCMMGQGWSTEPKSDPAEDFNNVPNRFNKVGKATDGSTVWYLKGGTEKVSGNILSGEVKVVNIDDKSKSYQGVFYYDADTNKTWFDNDSRHPVSNSGSIARLIAEKIKERSK